MSDIYGRDTYEHLEALGSDAERLNFLQASARLSGRAPLNFEAIDPATMGATRAPQAASALGYMQTNWESVTAVVQEKLFQEYTLREFVPVNDMYPEGTQTIPVEFTSWAGEPVQITHDGSNVPLLVPDQEKVAIPSSYWGIKATLLNEDVNTAMLTGIPLQARSEISATRSCMQKIDEILMTGAGVRDEKGLVNQPTGAGKDKVTNTASGAAFSTYTTAAAWEPILMAAINRIISETSGIAGEKIMGELVVLCSPAVCASIGSVRIADTGISLWEYIRANNPWTALGNGRNSLTLKSSVFCEAANNPDSAKDRIVIYPRSDTVLQIFEIIAPRIASMVQMEYGVSIPFEFKVTGLHVATPGAIQYITSA